MSDICECEEPKEVCNDVCGACLLPLNDDPRAEYGEVLK